MVFPCDLPCLIDLKVVFIYFFKFCWQLTFFFSTVLLVFYLRRGTNLFFILLLFCHAAWHVGS